MDEGLGKVISAMSICLAKDQEGSPIGLRPEGDLGAFVVVLEKFLNETQETF